MSWKFLKKGTTANIYIHNSKKFIKKIYLPPISEKRKKYFINEIKFLLLLQDYDQFPNLYFFDDDDYTLIMDFCGASLNDRSIEIPFDFSEQIYEIERLLKSKNINHNDIKTKNICMAENKIYLIDFQLSELVKEDEINNGIFFKKILNQLHQQDRLHKPSCISSQF